MVSFPSAIERKEEDHKETNDDQGQALGGYSRLWTERQASHANEGAVIGLTDVNAIGSITPVEPGRMRNTWYPRQKAAYVTMTSLMGQKTQNLAAERDFTFGMKPKEEAAPEKVMEEKPIEVQPKLLSVGRIYTVGYHSTIAADSSTA